jgi:outer membrane protein, multidrug efflux system
MIGENLSPVLVRARWLSLGLLMGGVGVACTAGPNYQRPAVETPDHFRGPQASAPGPALADRSWSDVFTDPALRALLTEAFRQNNDLRSAAARVLQAQAQAGVVRSTAWPSLNATLSAADQRSIAPGRPRPVEFDSYQVGAALSWELSFWGKYTRASESARAQILASEWGQRAVATSLVSQCASAYFQLRALDRQLEIAQHTLTTRQESLRLTQVRETGGAGTLVDVRQAEQLVQGAQAQIVDLSRLIEQQENLLSVLIGHAPGPVVRGTPLTDQPRVTEIPTGLPSELLERRPDIQVAEQRLVAANAQIGFAQASYFPSVTLNATTGLAGPALDTLLSAPALVWSATAGAVQPLFNAGRIASQVDLARAQREEALAAYRQTLLQAFREVSNALTGYQRGREYRAIQTDLVGAAREARRLADLRYQGGATSYLEVLDSDTRLFSAELGLVQAELAELSAFVEIYRALGGGFGNPG